LIKKESPVRLERRPCFLFATDEGKIGILDAAAGQNYAAFSSGLNQNASRA